MDEPTEAIPPTNIARPDGDQVPWDLIEIRKCLNEEAARRESELSLDRRAVVFAVAAWQTYAEQLTLAMVAESAPPARPR